MECKTTDKKSYRLTRNVWSKIASEALKDGMKVPMMCIDLQGGQDRVAVFDDRFDWMSTSYAGHIRHMIAKDLTSAYTVLICGYDVRWVVKWKHRSDALSNLYTIPWHWMVGMIEELEEKEKHEC